MALNNKFQLVMWIATMVIFINVWSYVQAQNKEVLLSTRIINEIGKIVGTLTIHHGQEPIDAIEEFRRDNNLSVPFRTQLLGNICRKEQVRCNRHLPLLLSTWIHDKEGKPLGILNIFENQEPVDNIYQFGKKHGLNYVERHNLLSSICGAKTITCSREQAVVLSKRITDESGILMGVLTIYENEEPIDAIHQFVKSTKMSKDSRHQLLLSACNSVACTRSTPRIFNQKIVLPDGKDLGNLEIYEGQEPADAVYQFGHAHAISAEMIRDIIYTICHSTQNPLDCTRTSALILSTPVVDEDGENLGILNIYDNEEPADAVYKFGSSRNITRMNRFYLLQNLCAKNPQLHCTRGDAILFQKNITDPKGNSLGELLILEEQEAADVVFEFAREKNLSKNIWKPLIQSVCNSNTELLKCNRLSPIVFSAPVAARNGSTLGILYIEDEEEPIDALGRFAKKYDLRKEERQVVLENVCRISGLPCTRNTPLLFSTPIAGPNQDKLDTLNIYEGEEPADKLYDFGLHYNLSFWERKVLLQSICERAKGKVECKRAEAAILRFPINESPEKEIGTLEIIEDIEPIDSVYAFLEKHDLFQTAPINTTLIEIVCNSTRVQCNRNRPRRILFSLQATFFGIPHNIPYVKPENDWVCEYTNGGKSCIHYVDIFCKTYCAKNMPLWDDCWEKVSEAMRNQLDIYEERVWTGKDLYAKLGLVRTATLEEIDAAFQNLVLRYNNETQPEKYTKLQDAYSTLSDKEKKYYYDLPCIKMFGLCAKRQPDGGMSITPDN